MNNSAKLPFCILLFLLLGSTLQAQTNESVILYNSKAVKVELSEVGKILSFYGLMPSYMEGYDLGPSYIEPEDSSVGAVESAVNDDQFRKNAEYDVISPERQELLFSKDHATLSSINISMLNQIATRLKNSDYPKILLTVYYGEETISALASNRVEAIMTYLSLKGVSPASIITETQTSSSLVNSIAINFVE